MKLRMHSVGKFSAPGEVNAHYASVLCVTVSLNISFSYQSVNCNRKSSGRDPQTDSSLAHCSGFIRSDCFKCMQFGNRQIRKVALRQCFLFGKQNIVEYTQKAVGKIMFRSIHDASSFGINDIFCVFAKIHLSYLTVFLLKRQPVCMKGSADYDTQSIVKSAL